MELGVSMFADLAVDPLTGIRKNTGERLKELIEEIKLADEVGLDVFGVGEHHREDYAVSSPEIILAAAATVTKNIKLGSAVTVLSSSNPIRVYQDFAMIDQLSGGRAELVAGRGSFIESFPLYGFDLKDYNTLFEENLDILLNANKNEYVTWQGRTRAPMDHQLVFPRAGEKGLDIWIAVGGTPQSVIRAARLGLPLMLAIIGGMPKQFIPLVNLYKEEYRNHGHDISKMRIGVHSHTFVGEDDNATADVIFPGYAAQMSKIGQERGWPAFTRAQYEAGRSLHGALLIGDANRVAEKILYQKEHLGITRFVAHLDIGAPSHKDLMKAIEILGTKVMPIVKK
ncbi:MAG: LLM class flavin-dependent oxidoreductase [Bacteroidia bacterium]|nr:MAG: LLM class flavin-dependent oxidoreductase [Bacteroidia bacterium]